MAKEFSTNKFEQLLGNYSAPVGTEDTSSKKESTPRKTKSVSTTKNKTKNTTDCPQRGFYIPNDLFKALNIKAATEEMGKSEIVQNALREYLKDYLEKDKNSSDL